MEEGEGEGTGEVGGRVRGNLTSLRVSIKVNNRWQLAWQAALFISTQTGRPPLAEATFFRADILSISWDLFGKAVTIGRLEVKYSIYEAYVGLVMLGL